MKELIERIAKEFDEKAVILCEREGITEFVLIDEETQTTTEFISIVLFEETNCYLFYDYICLVPNIMFLKKYVIKKIEQIIDEYNKEIKKND